MSLNLGFVEVLLGHRLIDAWQICYEFQGETDRTVAAVELKFNHAYLNLSGASNGENLQLSNEPWQDPFKEPLIQANQDYVKQYGKHLKASTNLFKNIGKNLTQYRLVQNQFQNIAGIELIFEESSSVFLVESDECYIMSKEDERISQWGFELIESTSQHVV